jgi:Flp pilus assembly protein TadD
MVRRRAKKALATLDRLRRRATGRAEPLALAASRAVALRLAAAAYERGKTGQARAFLIKARQIDRASPKVAHNEVVLLLATGKRIDHVIAKLQRFVGEVPEAHVNLGVAHEKKGEHAKALEHFRKAQRAGARHPELGAWIAAKERIWGGGE